MGEKGSLCYFNGQTFIEESQKVTPIDTTGAGDAFYGTFLANIESKAITENTIRQALRKANEVGAKTTLHYGAIV